MGQGRERSAHAVNTLFDTPTDLRVRDMIVGPVSNAEAEQMCADWHYSGHIGTTANLRFGLWHGVSLLGVVTYNIPARSVCESVFGPEHWRHVWHMGRLALIDDAPHNSESRLISGSLRQLPFRKVSVGYEPWAVVTYADTTAGHVGYVYQATNALYTGTATVKPHYLTPRGERRSPYNDGSSITRSMARDQGWTVVEGGIKHRYLYVLGGPSERRRRRELVRLPALDHYPKEDRHD